MIRSALNPGVKLREFFAWAMFDFANSAYTTVIITAVFNAYFVGVVANKAPWATLLWTLALAASYLAIMLSAPAIGAYADRHARKKALLLISTLACIAFTAALGWVGPGDVALAVALIVLSNFFYGTGENLAAAFLPELARPQALGKISGMAWAVGYLGGLAALGLALAWILHARKNGVSETAAVPTTMLITAGFFALASIPAFALLRERAAATSLIASTRNGLSSSGPSTSGPSTSSPSSSGLAQTLKSLRDLSEFPDLRRFLLCILAYQAGIQIVIAITAIYAQEALGFSTEQTLRLVLIVNVAAALGAFGFGMLQDRLGHQRTLMFTLLAWLATIVLVATSQGSNGFWFAANLAGLCLGSAQSAGRALVGYLSPSDRLGEFFGLWGLAVKCSAILGPVCYGLVTWLTAGNHRLAMLSCGVFFVVGMALLAGVNVARGRAQASRSQSTA